jgi:poly(3-hydroxybutyrate) depolymerase
MSTRTVLCLALALAGVGCGSSSNEPPAGFSIGVDAGKPSADAGTDAGGTRSAGCGAFPSGAIGQYVRHDLVVSNVAPAYASMYTNRYYWLRLPPNYDPDRAYPTVFLGPGCGESGQAPIPIEMASKNDAILVGLNGVDNCFNHDAADTPDLPYFDAMVAEVEASACVDKSHLFVEGFSSGSWLASYLGCVRGDILRAQASSAGGLPPIPPSCTGPIPAMYASDTDDTKNPPATVKVALARVLAANGCSADTKPYDFGVPSPCVEYQGCMPGFPVVYCETSGYGHSDQAVSKISTVGFWHFWTSLDQTAP